MADKITYDRAATWDGTPYRSEALCVPDERKVMSAKVGTPVQVILNHGDEYWTNAIKVRMDSIEDGAIVRYFVRIADGTEHMVSADRIRLRTW